MTWEERNVRWQSGRRSKNVVDRQGSGRGRSIAGGGIGTIVLILVALYFGVDPSFLIDGMREASVPASRSESGSRPGDLANDPMVDMISVVIADTEEVWSQIFSDLGRRYEEPRLIIFDGTTPSACGLGQAAMGPFYCPADKNAYIDLSFYRDLQQRFDAPGDFAQAYVIAHEIGHHVQNLLGISDEVHRIRRQSGEVESNQLSVRLELQADCFAGVWANRTARGTNIVLERGDIEEALKAASAIGDDRLQKQSTGRVAPDSFTHGSSAQRVKWFRTGFENGSPDGCDTFSANSI